MKLPTARCPHCLRKLDAAMGVTDATAHPKEGDYTVCLYCQAPLTYAADLSLRTQTAGEHTEFLALLAGEGIEG